MLIKGQHLRLNITEIQPDGYGVGQWEAYRVFVYQTITGDEVTVEVTRIKAQQVYAKIVEIHQPSPHRVTPLCTHFGVCGACTWQHVHRALQISMRRDQIIELFQTAQLPLDTTIIEDVFLSAYQYRRRARLSVRYDKKKDKMYVGFREIDPRFIAKISTCVILENPLWPKRWIELFHQLECRALIPQLEYMSGANEECFIIRLLGVPSLSDLEKIHAFRNQYSIRIFIQAHSALNVIEMTDDLQVTHNNIHKQSEGILGDGTERIDYQCGKLTLNAGSFDFIQINKEIAQWMLENALLWLNPRPEDTLLDLCCGLGPFALTFAPYVKHAHGIELEESMVNKAREHAQKYLLTNTTFQKGDLFNPPGETVTNYDLLIVDPPRSGLSHLSAWVKAVQPRALLYVSCNADTMVRDITPLLQSGEYQLTRLAVMDMFAQTKHAETMILLTKLTA